MTIRRWLLLAWLATILSIAGFFQLAIRGQTLLQEGDSHEQLEIAQKMLVENPAQWNNPEWQTNFAASFKPLRLKLIITSTTDTEIYRLGNPTLSEKPVHKIMLLNTVGQIQTASLFEQTDISQLRLTIVTLVLLTQLSAIIFIGWFLGRTLLKPLAAMSQAARQIASGDLNFSLPNARRVREVAEVSTAFEAMGNALREALEKQAKLEQERRLFISAVAHDLRTPLFSLRGYLEGLERGIAQTPEKTNRYIRLCQEKATLLENRVASLFSYARIEYMGQITQRQRLSFAALIYKTIETLKPQIEAKNLSVTLNEPPEDCSVEGDEALLLRVIENLLDNAVRHTPDKGQIEIRWYMETNWLYFQVADSGAGIAPADLPQLFTPRYQMTAASNRQTGGVGLGLVIAQRILQAHGGSLSAANRASGGTEFNGKLLLASN